MRQMDFQETVSKFVEKNQVSVFFNRQDSPVRCSQSVIAQHVKTSQSQCIQHVQTLNKCLKYKCSGLVDTKCASLL